MPLLMAIGFATVRVPLLVVRPAVSVKVVVDNIRVASIVTRVGVVDCCKALEVAAGDQESTLVRENTVVADESDRRQRVLPPPLLLMAPLMAPAAS